MESTTSNTLPVDIKIASPCSAKWADMPGGDTVRSCAHCARKVYNLSEMPTAEAADLIRAAEGKLCVRFYRRADGTIMTKDCPTGLRAVRVRAARVIGVAFASLLVWSGFSVSSRPRSEYPYLLRLLLDRVDPIPAPAGRQVMGGIRFLPMASPTPSAAPEPRPEITMGAISVVAPPSDKPFLRGLEVDNAPREDPFAPEAKAKKRAAK